MSRVDPRVPRLRPRTMVFEVALRAIHWGVPWLIVLAISASLTLAFMHAVVPNSNGPYVQPTPSLIQVRANVEPVYSPSADGRCGQPLGGGHPRDNGAPETKAPPPWCGQ